MGTYNMITVFQDVILYSVGLREPAASVFRVKAVWEHTGTGNQDSIPPNRRQWLLKVQIIMSSITFPPVDYSSSLSSIVY